MPFFAHPDDYVKDALVHDDDRLLVHQTIRQTFEIAFAYDSVHSTSELSAKLSKQVKETLEEIFLRHILCVTSRGGKTKAIRFIDVARPEF